MSHAKVPVVKYPFRPHEIVWIKSNKNSFDWPGFITKIREVRSEVKMYYRFILKGKPCTFVSPINVTKFRKFHESDVLDENARKNAGLVAAFESAKTYLLMQSTMKSKDKHVQMFTPMKYFFPVVYPKGITTGSRILKSDEENRPGRKIKEEEGHPFCESLLGKRMRRRSLNTKNSPKTVNSPQTDLAEELIEMQIRHQKEFHEARMENERLLAKESRELHQAKLGAIELSTVLSEELHRIETETARLKYHEAEINKNTALFKLKQVELQLKNYESAVPF